MNNVGNAILICMFYLRIIGIVEWSIILLLLMEVILCKDAKTVDKMKLMNTPLRVRLRMFKKSWKSHFYKGTFILFFCALFSMVSMISDMWLGHMPRAPYSWTLISLFLPFGIFLTYLSRGYRITLFSKFYLFIKDQHD
jgi:hypothetical protein